MSLLDDAREMAASNIAENFDKECGFCGMSPSLHDVEGWEYRADSLGVLHYPECPWLAMPRIVAVLEAAERLLEPRYQGEPYEEYGAEHLYVFCRGDARTGVHIADCRYQALVAALRGEQVTAE